MNSSIGKSITERFWAVWIQLGCFSHKIIFKSFVIDKAVVELAKHNNTWTFFEVARLYLVRVSLAVLSAVPWWGVVTWPGTWSDAIWTRYWAVCPLFPVGPLSINCSEFLNWWLVRATYVVDGLFWEDFFAGGGNSAHTREFTYSYHTWY